MVEDEPTILNKRKSIISVLVNAVSVAIEPRFKMMVPKFCRSHLESFLLWVVGGVVDAESNFFSRDNLGVVVDDDVVLLLNGLVSLVPVSFLVP